MFLGIFKSHAYEKQLDSELSLDSSPALIVSRETENLDYLPNAFYPSFDFSYYSNSSISNYQFIPDLSIKQPFFKNPWSKTALILFITGSLVWGLGKNRQRHTEIHHLNSNKKGSLSKIKTKQILVIGTNQGQYLALIDNGFHAKFASDNDNIPTILQQNWPNFILLDLNMSPEKSKLILGTIRSMDTRHQIKIVTYGGAPNFSQKLWALFHGADEYIYGPISLEILENHLFTSWHHLGFLEDSLPLQRTSILKKNKVLEQLPDSMDDCFIEKVFHAILEHYEDEHFNIDELAALVNQSRSNLYRKVKQQTGRTPNNLIRLARITKSAHLLASKAGTVSEIAYSSGFSSLSYFSKVFTASFGISPSSYMESH
ncbi:helix-turn-helix domain-containing protein [Echinicola salinicaeni]|uniref:helix-turn-helix domain-containing protein n=1 Tax=Echinicola salinicaeni TaxID=2762757 RepID=UPI0016487D5D|nr:helix-turn-helix domain-containing protein [Echinicola salinicaeni]